jgi:hypothetical protein
MSGKGAEDWGGRNGKGRNRIKEMRGNNTASRVFLPAVQAI